MPSETPPETASETPSETTPDRPAQLELAHMPRQLFACTPSRLAAFDCPRRYRFTYLDRPAPPRGQPWAHNVLGATAHLALHRWWLLPRAHRTADEGASLVERHWQPLGFRDHRQSESACTRTADWVRDYLATRVRARDEPVGVERTVAARTQRLALSGRVDRLDDRDGELVVVDFKTGRHRPTVDDARGSAALALYAVGVRSTLRRPCRRVELHHLPTNTVTAAEHTDESLREHVDRAERTADRIVDASARLAEGADPDAAFPPVTGPGCGWCDFRRHCPQGREEAPDLEPWAGLPADLV